MAALKWDNLLLFVEQLAAAAKLNLPLDKAIETLSHDAGDDAWRGAQKNVAELVRLGSPLSEAMGNYPGYFPTPLRRMVRVAEEGQAMPLMLDKASRYLQFAGEIKNRLQKCMIYPLIIWLILMIDMGVLIFIVGPKYMDIYDGLDMTPPPLTTGLVQYGPMVVVFLIGLAFYLAWLAVGFLGGLAENRTGLNRWAERVMIYLPFFGAIQRHAKAAEVCEILSALSAGGRSAREAVTLAKQAVESPVLEQAFDEVDAALLSGDDFQPKSGETLVPRATLWMLSETGAGEGLSETLDRLARHHHRQMDLMANLARETLEPLLLMLVAVMVAFTLLAFYTPIISNFLPLFSVTQIIR
ncbi:MAG: hypothetical protein GC154_14660 [bacterium]|nr:hypothetical protein [bacterium]